jgi:hypothetical protein
MVEVIPYRPESGASKVPITFHQDAMLCCNLQHDYMDYILENNLPL